MAAETGFLIDGTIYEVPPIDSFDLDEAELLYETCGLTQEEFLVPEQGETEEEHDLRMGKLMRSPKVLAVLMRIAYQRGNPDTKPDQVKLVVGKTNRFDAVLSLMADDENEEEPEVPLESTSEPAESSESDSLENEPSTSESTKTSGSDSTNDSAPPDDPAANTGTTRLGISSISVREISAA